MSLKLVVHEKIGYWGRQLPGRLANRAVRIVESRSAEDLERALENTISPLIVIDLGHKNCNGLEDLARALRIASDALALVIDPENRQGVSLLARELGATHVLAGIPNPPEVADLIARWISLAQERVRSAGWEGRLPETLLSDPLAHFFQ